MCGLVGGWQRHSSSAFGAALEKALTSIEHRGPNDTGTYVWDKGDSELLFGSTRLSVLDLSSAGHMPMVSADQNYVVAYNGEITNYVEIREELAAQGFEFRSGTDTEVLLTAWQAWGEESIKKFEGMFAFAMHDVQRQLVFLARDCFGIKPLFFHVSDGRMYFASEIQAIKNLLPWKLEINQQVAFDYLHWGHYDSSEETFIEGIRQIRPGHLLKFDLTEGKLVSNERYWWPEITTRSDFKFDEATEYVREQFLSSVQRNLRTDVPLGIALSGGVDSSAITCAIRKIEPDLELNTFSFVTPGFEKSEHEWARFINEQVNARGHEVIPGPHDLGQDLDEMILAQGEPFGSTSIYAQFRVFKAAKEAGMTVTLDGQGADEIFAGYDGYPLYKIHSLYDQGKFSEASEFITNWGKWPNRDSDSLRSIALRSYGMLITPTALKAILKPIFNAEATSELYQQSMVNRKGASLEVPKNSRSRSRGVRQRAHMREQLMLSGLPALLRHGDRNSMHFSIESRVPFLDKQLVEFVLGLPEKYLVSHQGESKHLLKAAMRGIVPDKILDRRDKVGFETPEVDWQQQYLTAHKSELMRSITKFNFLDDKKVQEYLGSPQTDTRFQWRLINLLRWSELAI